MEYQLFTPCELCTNWISGNESLILTLRKLEYLQLHKGVLRVSPGDHFPIPQVFPETSKGINLDPSVVD